MRRLMTLEQSMERRKQRALLEKIFGKPQRTAGPWRKSLVVKPNNVRKKMNVSDATFQSCIAEYSTGRFKIKKGDVSTNWTFSASATPRKKRNRKLDTRSARLTLIHRPTGVSQPCYIKPGHYSKAEMRKLRETTVEEYLPFLERKVKGYLKACMARQFGPIPKGEYEE